MSRNTWRCNRCNRTRKRSEAPAGFIDRGHAPICRRCVRELEALAKKKPA